MAPGRLPNLRLETADRSQVSFDQICLDDLLSWDHAARQVWAYVEGLDLSELYGRVQTTVTSSGRPAIDPAILMALWLYATVDGIGSARLLDRKCVSDAAYRWLAGGVGVNYHTLADFRVAAGPLLDRLLSSSIAGLIASGIVSVEALAVDGMRVQASANKSTFRSGGRLAELHEAAKQTVERLRREVEEDPGEASRRQRSRQLAAAEDRARRVAEAQRAQAEIEGKRAKEAKEQRRKEGKSGQKLSRGSTSDATSRVMKMGDGSFKPAYNVQLTTTLDKTHVIGVSVTNQGSDRGLLGPALDQAERRYGAQPSRVLADGGYDSRADMERLHAVGITLYCPLPRKKEGKADPALPRDDDGPGTAAWRQRMATPEAQALYRQRFATERPHAHMRNHGLRQFVVRGLEKVKAVALWHVHAFNFLQFKRLGLI